MDATKDPSQPPAAAAANLQTNAPLAPSQEAAYRKKCIQLKRRLNEIEANNDATRRRIEQEKQHVQKMRLMRAILLDHLKTVAETPGKKLSPEQFEELGLRADGRARVSEMVGIVGEARPDGEGLLDDSSDESEEDPEPAERPERRRRNNNNYRESIMTTTPGPNPSLYQQPGLPSLAPATTFSPSAPRDPTALTSSFRVSNTPQTTTTTNPAYPVNEYPQSSPLAHIQNPAYSQPPRLEPAATTATSPTSVPPASSNSSNGGNSRPLPPQPQRPSPPFQQFTDHMRPQLEADDYPLDQIDSRIDQEWRNLSKENKDLWEVRYAEQMMEFTQAMDEWKRQQKKVNNSVAGVSFSETRNRT